MKKLTSLISEKLQIDNSTKTFSGIKLVNISKETQKAEYLDILDLLDDSQKILLQNEELKFKIWKESNRRRDNIYNWSALYADPRRVSEDFDKAVVYEYDGCRKTNPSSSRIQKMQANERSYKSIYDDMQHVVLVEYQVYNYQGNYLRVCIEAVYDPNDYKTAGEKRYKLKDLGLKPGDLVAWDLGNSDTTNMFIVDSVQPATMYREFKINTDIQYASLFKEQPFSLNYIGGRNLKGVSGAHTVDSVNNGELWQFQRYSNDSYSQSGTFKKARNVRVNDEKDIKKYIDCATIWLQYLDPNDNKNDE